MVCNKYRGIEFSVQRMDLPISVCLRFINIFISYRPCINFVPTNKSFLCFVVNRNYTVFVTKCFISLFLISFLRFLLIVFKIVQFILLPFIFPFLFFVFYREEIRKSNLHLISVSGNKKINEFTINYFHNAESRMC